MDEITWRDRARYAFDSFMARGTPALILGLFAASLLVIVVVSLAVLATGAAAERNLDFPALLWRGLMRTLDPGTMGGDEGSPAFLAGMLAVTLGGIFVISTLIGIINAGLQDRLAELRKGRSRVIEHGHIVILGWSAQIHTVIAELVEANRNRGGLTVVVLAARDKVEMEDEIRDRVGSPRRTKVVCRSGSPLDADDLPIVSVRTARAIVVLAPEVDDPDADVIKTLLAITKHPSRRTGRYHIVAEIRERTNMAVAHMVARDEVELIASEDVTSRIIAQTCRQAGLSVVYSELLDFAGHEIYFVLRPGLLGRTFGQALTAFPNATLIGLAPAEGPPILNPPSDRTIEPEDRLIVIAEDDTGILGAAERIHGVVGAAPEVAIDESRILEPVARPEPPERTLLLGWNHRAPTVIRELDQYAPPGSEVVVVADAPDAEQAAFGLGGAVRNQRVRFLSGNSSSRATLESLQLATFDHVVVLCYSDALDVERADARTLVTLLHLRDLVAQIDRRITIVSEMLDLRDRSLAEVARADDFIVSEQLISLMIAQVAENRQLNAVFHRLLDPAGVEIYLRPVGDYVALDRPVAFETLVEAARRRGETAFGYRIAAEADDRAAGYGVRLNPPKGVPTTFAPTDRIVVLAEG
jgi:voltage-gated potassium channel Kch